MKLPIGCNVIVEREASGAKDEYALLCKAPSDLDDAMMEMVMKSKSAKRSIKCEIWWGKRLVVCSIF